MIDDEDEAEDGARGSGGGGCTAEERWPYRKAISGVRPEKERTQASRPIAAEALEKVNRVAERARSMTLYERVFLREREVDIYLLTALMEPRV